MRTSVLYGRSKGSFVYTKNRTFSLCRDFCFSPTVQKPRFQRLVGSKQTFAGVLSAPQPPVCTMRRGVTGAGHRETIEERAEEAEKAGFWSWLRRNGKSWGLNNHIKDISGSGTRRHTGVKRAKHLQTVVPSLDFQDKRWPFCSQASKEQQLPPGKGYILLDCDYQIG